MARYPTRSAISATSALGVPTICSGFSSATARRKSSPALPILPRSPEESSDKPTSRPFFRKPSLHIVEIDRLCTAASILVENHNVGGRAAGRRRRAGRHCV